MCKRLLDIQEDAYHSRVLPIVPVHFVFIDGEMFVFDDNDNDVSELFLNCDGETGFRLIK